ncbi:MAG: hypothetical protein WCC64_20450 [Aliidongia sp.]
MNLTKRRRHGKRHSAGLATLAEARDDDLDDIVIDTIIYSVMTKPEDIVAQMRANPANIRFADLKKVCGRYFGQPSPGWNQSLRLSNALAR